MQNPLIQQVVEALRGANNVLITVKNSPSVDELTAAIALTLILNHMNKHATTVFSGKVPSTIEFLQPDMAIESNTDSLRDFIIALDKSKADKLRYKVEDNVVRIFITPYKSSISEADLEFSQGDFNVDVVVALGVLSSDDFDQAVMAHGRILHDATVIAITNQNLQQDVGVVNWQDPSASSVSEMIATITDLFGVKVMDSQIATALMTGIVAETDRFKNEKTTPQVLSVSSMLMTEGANQMLIAEELEQPPQVESPFQPLNLQSQDETPDAAHGEDGTLSVPHEQNEVGNINIDEQGNIDTFGAVGEEAPAGPNGMFDAQPSMPSMGDAAAEMSSSLPSNQGMPFDNPLEESPAPEPGIVSERPYLGEPLSEHHEDADGLSEPSGLFGDSMHEAAPAVSGSPVMFGRGPKVIQPVEENASAPAQGAEGSEGSAQEPAPAFTFGTSGHTDDVPGEYQAVASDPITPYSPPVTPQEMPVEPQLEHHDDSPPSVSPPAAGAPPIDLPDVSALSSNEPQTLADIERSVGSDHVREAADLPQPPHTPSDDSQENQSVDDFIGSVRAPQPSLDVPSHEELTPEPPEHGAAPDQPIAPHVPSETEQATAPAPIVVEPYQPPAPLHDHDDQHTDASAPPQVPPPLTMPKATTNVPVFYDSKGTQNNPFADQQS